MSQKVNKRVIKIQGVQYDYRSFEKAELLKGYCLGKLFKGSDTSRGGVVSISKLTNPPLRLRVAALAEQGG